MIREDICQKVGPYLLLVGVLSFICFLPVQAQDSEERLFHGIVHAGVSSSQISGDNLSGFNQAGLCMGLGLELQNSTQWKPRVELQFCQLGSRRNAQPDKGIHDSYFLRLNYVQIPLSIGYVQGSTGFEFGLVPAILLSSIEEDENGKIPGLGREFEDYDFGLSGGIRYAFHEKWELGTRIIQSVIPVREHNAGSTFRLNQGQYNTGIQFLLRFNV